jgi:hypothetical protein
MMKSAAQAFERLTSGLNFLFRAGSRFLGRAVLDPRFFPLALVALGLLVAVPANMLLAGDQDQTYTPPHHDVRLDWCLTWGANCGRPAALAFCNRRRYEDVADFSAQKVGRSEPTRTFGSNETCSGQDFCTAFASITCTRPIARERIFANPSLGENRQDNCREWSANCGKPAADAFCQRNGFSSSFQSSVEAERSSGPTQVISNGQVCTRNCVGFQQIICQ